MKKYKFYKNYLCSIKFNLIIFLIFLISFHNLFYSQVFKDFNFFYFFLFQFVSFLVFDLIFTTILKFFFGSKIKYIFTSYFFLDDKKTGYKLRPNINSKKINFYVFDKFIFQKKKTHKIKTNSLSYYGPEIDFSKEAIYCMGDSTSTMYKLDYNKTWPELLRKNKKEQIINACVNGYDSTNNILRLKQSLKYGIKIKKIIVYQGWNDEFNYLTKKNSKKLLNFKQNNELLTKSNLFVPSNFIFFYNLQKLISKNIFLYNNNFYNSKRWKIISKSGFKTQLIKNYIQLLNICSKNKIELFIIDYPNLINSNHNENEKNYLVRNTRLNKFHYEYQRVSKKISKLIINSFNNNANIIHASEFFEKLNVKKRNLLFHDEIHLNSKGHKILSKIILRYLNSQKKHRVFLNLNYNDIIKSVDQNTEINNIIKKEINKIV